MKLGDRPTINAQAGVPRESTRTRMGWLLTLSASFAPPACIRRPSELRRKQSARTHAHKVSGRTRWDCGRTAASFALLADSQILQDSIQTLNVLRVLEENFQQARELRQKIYATTFAALVDGVTRQD
jgi:hypothetical protein